MYDAAAALGGRRFESSTQAWAPSTGYRTSGAGPRWRPPRGAGGLPLPERVPSHLGVFAEEELRVEHDYFPARLEFDEPGTYADLGADTDHNRTEEWQHTLGDIVSAITDAGLRLELLHEHDHTLSPRWGFLERAGHDTWRMPAGQPRIPLMFSLRASAP